MADNVDILLNDTFSEVVVDGDFAIGDGRLDDCNIIFKLNTGACKSDPILGPNLILMMNSYTPSSDIKQKLSLHLERDGKHAKRLDIVEGNIKCEL